MCDRILLMGSELGTSVIKGRKCQWGNRANWLTRASTQNYAVGTSGIAWLTEHTMPP